MTDRHMIAILLLMFVVIAMAASVRLAMLAPT